MADSETSEPIIKDALERFEESQDGSSFNRNDAYEDIKFSRLGEQWPEDIKKVRQAEGRPCLTINKLPAFVRQVVNESRQNKPGIKVSPVDNGADVETAEVIGGLIRSVERGSNAEIAYDTAIDHAVSGGFGFFRIAIDYCHPDSFNLEARIERVPNPLMVHWDVNSTQFDASDWEYGFISDFVTKDQFKLRYPKAETVSFEGDTRDATSYWLQDDKIRIAEYWLRSEKKRNLLMLAGPDGQPMTIREDQLPIVAKNFFQSGGIDLGGQVKDDEIAAAFMQARQLQETRRREVTYYEVKRRIISGVEVLSEDPWPGETIPICPVWGEEVYLDGRRHFRSLIRDAKDPQTMFNFWRSASTELVALAPRAPWVGPKGFVPKGDEAKWQTANTRSHAYLEYDASSGNAPQRQPFAGVPAGAIQEGLNASDDMKAIIGIYDSSLGARSNETSGRAIMARQREADVSNFHFIDNLSRAIRYAGRVLVEIIPAVYGPRQTIRILGEDQKEKVVHLVQQDGGSQQPGIDGEKALYNLSVGQYDVTVSTGPSYATQREETKETLIEIMRQVPGAAQYIGDILLENMDFPGADKVAKRLQMLLPPAIQQAEGIKGPQPQAPQVNPLDDEEKKAKIQNLRASAIAALAKAGATQLDTHVSQMEAVVNALTQNQPAPIPAQNPGAPAQPGPTPANPQGPAGF